MRPVTALACVLLLATPAAAQQWGNARDIPPSESLIDIKLKGWGKASFVKATTNAGGANDLRMEVINSSVTAASGGYYAALVVHEAPNQTTWNQDTIQNIANSFFSQYQPELGEYFDVDHGPAEFRAIPVRITDKDKKVNCAAYRAYWRSYSSLGLLCAPPSQPLPPETVKTFITHISYKNELAPKGEGVLP